MTNRLRLQCLRAFLLFFCINSFQLHGQVFSGVKLDFPSPKLSAAFTSYEVYTMDAEQMALYVRSGADANTLLMLGDHTWNLELTSSNLLSANYTLRVQTPNGIEVSHKRPNIAFKGYEANGGRVRLTLDKNVIYGFIEEGDKVWRIEPLHYLDHDAPKNLYVVYEKSAVIPTPGIKCGVTAEMEKAAHLHDEADEKQVVAGMSELGVYELELAIASDALMVDAYGSPDAVEAHNVGVINAVEVDYTGSFNHDLCFNIVTQFVATSFPGPWTGSNDAGALLGSFADWGQGGGFGVSFDMGEIWTARNFTGSTVGIAYLNGVCNSVKYHALSDFGGTSEEIRCMTSHEIGHNFSSNHDGGCNGGEFIMCPFVSEATAWSAQSQNAINNYMQSKINSGCLSTCVQGPPVEAAFDWNPDPGCVGQAVQFTDQSTGGTITTWNWTFQGGIPATSNQQNPSVVFNTTGQKNVTLTASGSNGSGSVTNVITINPLPVASFTSDMDDLTITLTNTSTDATSYLWEFGDGLESTEQDPVYTYSEPGVYVVKLTATNACGTSTKTITVNTAPRAEFSGDPTSGCASMFVTMSNESSANATSFSWQFPGAIPSTSGLKNPIVTYNISGTYSITLTATNSTGSHTVTKTNYITVRTAPAPGFNSSANGLTVTFTNTSQNANTFHWTFGDGDTSNVANPVHTYADGGAYTVTLVVTNECGSNTISKLVNIAPPPVAAFTTSGNSGCAPLTVVFTNNSTGATSYSWAMPGADPATSTDANPTAVYNTAGTYTVTLTATNASGSSTATATITVTTVPGAGFTNTNNGAVVTFSNTTTNGTSYSWNFGDNTSSTDANPTHTYAADGIYTVVLTATNDCGTASITKTVTVATPPTANYTASPTSGCAPLTVQFTNASSANAVSYVWTFPGGNPATSTAANPTVVYNTPGVYSVTLEAINGVGNSILTKTDYITVNTTPSAGFTSSTSNSTATFTNTSTNAVSYAWDFGDTNSSTDANPVHTYATDGVYTVVLSATNACGTVTSTQTVTIVTPPVAGFNTAQTNGCAPFSVQFNNTSSNNSVTYNWEFPGGEPASSTEQNPVVVYNAPGVYSVVLTVSNAAGSNTSTQTDYITVGTGPAAGFSATVAAATATFANSSTGATTYAWDFGDNTSSTDANPTHTYAADGQYTVVLTATNNCGTSTFTQTVSIITNPEAGFTANVTSGCAPLTVEFTDLSSDNTTAWSWSFPGGTPETSSAQNPTVVYNTPGTYDVTLVATGPGGTSTFTRTAFITVTPLPTTSFTSSTSQNTVSFTNTSVDATSYLWTFGDGTNSVETNPTHTYATDGTFTVTLSATNICGTITTEQTVTIVTPPVAAFTFNSSMGCAPLAVVFNNTSSSNATSFSWDFPGGNPATSTDASPVVTWNTPGVYIVTMTATNAAGSSTATASITVNTVPTAGFTSQNAGLSVVMTNTSSNADSYAWTFGDGSESTEANPTHTYATTGTYTVTLVATNGCGSTTITQEVSIIGSAPIAAITANLTSGCAGMTIQFTDASVGNPTSWNWTFEGGTPGTSTEQNPSVTYNTPGTYSVTLDAGNIFGNSTAQITGIVIENLPTAGFGVSSSNTTVNFLNTSTGGGTYSWNFGDGTTSNEENPVHTYAATGNYTVSLTVTNSCGSNTLQQTVVVSSVGTQEAAWLDQFLLFPNPNAGQFTVEMTGVATENVLFALFNQLGQRVYSNVVDFSSGRLTQSFDFTHLPAAIYTLRVEAQGSAKHVKVVVQR
jgi:PKD repeat protein